MMNNKFPLNRSVVLLYSFIVY